ncbi:TPM domain-containing protein [Roseibacillus persicicus]|uniref:TPM domain-containing protein n=1 Tax=Roseibacillus persicicus TaxID=454148 RepID=UPI00280E9EDB|nr:TPM domain-containing protein [Roseibacillus persicicus]MDQ8190869.1 TPM domain-containing protein [Roseibacillus persicicus]
MKKAKEERKKVYAAKRFARGAMVCPSCLYTLDESVEACPKCKFSGQIAVQKFPFPAPPLGPVLDPNNYLSEEEKSAVTKKVLKLQKRFPQVRFYNCVVPLGEEVNLREFGFWLFNASQVKEGDSAKSFGILLLVDPKERMMSVTVGYGMEVVVTDSEWTRICQDSRDLFYRQKYGQGIETFLNRTFDVLSERALAMQKEVKR